MGEMNGMATALLYKRLKFAPATQILDGVENLCTPKGLYTIAQGRDAGAHPGTRGPGNANSEGVVHPHAL